MDNVGRGLVACPEVRSREGGPDDVALQKYGGLYTPSRPTIPKKLLSGWKPNLRKITIPLGRILPIRWNRQVEL